MTTTSHHLTKEPAMTTATLTTAAVSRMPLAEARALADRVIDRTNYRPALVALWQAHDALDAAFLTSDEERADFARKDAVLSRIALAGTR